MIRVNLPAHLSALAKTGDEITLTLEGPVTIRNILVLVETRYPALRGTIRDQSTLKRRPMIRFFACEEDWSHESPEALLPETVATGAEPLYIIGAIAGG